MKREQSLCPACGTNGSTLKPVTLRALLRKPLQEQVREDSYRFCASPDCDLVYFSEDGLQRFTKGDLQVPVGVKESEGLRPLCYCFGHSFESLQGEWIAEGKISALESIQAEVKAGRCRCEITNPRGICCLGDIAKAIREIQVDGGTETTQVAEGCCETLSVVPPDPPDGIRARTALSALMLGLLASACCWLPLLLAGIGVAGGAVGARVAFLRPWALGTLMVFLAGVVSWWAFRRFTEVRKDTCCREAPAFPVFPALVLALSFLGAWATPHLLHPGGKAMATPSAPTPGGQLLVLSTPQFACPSCVGDLPQFLAKTPGVASVEMDFDQRQTHIRFRNGAEIQAILAEWKRTQGFDGLEVLRKPY